MPTLDDSCLYPDADWLIGNHSDELTPWLPVFAALSSYKCNFFLLPCCSYELNGQKYQRQNSSKSQYMDYMDHVAKLADSCGFCVKFDKLRIPSTKRVSIIGDTRKYPINEHSNNVCAIRNLIELNCSTTDISNKCSDNETMDYNNFLPRSNEIKVRNCTQLDKHFVNDLVKLIATKILNPPVVLDSTNVSDSKPKTISMAWNEGVAISLKELAMSLPREHLIKLKKECGGLQTLIRNHHYVFKIDKGLVHFRKPLSVKDRVNKGSFKTKQCWFYTNHPDMCPLIESDCPYIHL